VSKLACEFQKVLYDFIFAPNPQCAIAVPIIQAPQSFQFLIRDKLTGKYVLEFVILIVPKPAIVSVSPQSIYFGSVITVSGNFFLPLSAVCIFSDTFRQVRSPATEITFSVMKCMCPDSLHPGGINVMLEVSFATENSTTLNVLASGFGILNLNSPIFLKSLNPSVIDEGITSSITVTGSGFSQVQTMFMDVGGFGLFTCLSSSSKQAICIITAVTTGNFSVLFFRCHFISSNFCHPASFVQSSSRAVHHNALNYKHLATISKFPAISVDCLW